MSSGSVTLPQSGGGGGGITSINGDTSPNQFIVGANQIGVSSTLGTTTISLSGPVSIVNGGTGQSNQQAALNNLTNIGAATNGDVLQYLGGNAQFAPFTAPPPTGDPNTFAYFNPSGDMDSIPNWSLLATPIQSSWNADLTYNPDNLMVNPFAQNLSLNIAPLQDSPSDSASILALSANLDSTSNGFTFGDGGRSVTMIAGNYNYGGNGSTYGQLLYENYTASIGNATDPVTVKGVSFSELNFSLNANATLDGAMQGVRFQPGFDAASITTSNVSVSVIVDVANLQTTIYGYEAFHSTPNILEIANNHNYFGTVIGPTIPTLVGNANFFGHSCGGTFTTMGASSTVQGFTFNPVITTMGSGSTFSAFSSFGNITTAHGNIYGFQCSPTVSGGDANVNGMQIYMGNVVSSGDIKGISVNTPTSLGTNSRAIDSQGHNSLACDTTVTSSLGQLSGNSVGGSIVIPNATAVTGTDVFGNNMAVGIVTGDATSSWTAASLVGLTSLGYVGQIVGDGAIIGPINMCLDGFAYAANGPVQSIRNMFCAGVPAGGTGAVGEHILYYADMPLGLLPGTTGPGGTTAATWGLRVDDSANSGVENFVTRLAVNTTTKKVSNDSCGLELGSTTQAIRFSNLTTAERLALTPLAGMMVFDTDLTQMAYYNGTTWVPF